MQVHLKVLLSLLMGLLAVAAHSGETLKLETPAARSSYSLGIQMGHDLKRQKVSLDKAVLLQGLTDGQSGAKPLMTEEEMRSLLAEVKRRIVAEMQKHRLSEFEAKQLPGIVFLEKNKSKPGVQTTETGLQYKVIKEGSGAQPGPMDRVLVHYRGSTIDGKEFDSSYKRGKAAEFKLNGVIKGWSEGLHLMREGAKYELYIPYQLAYSQSGPLAYKTLVFEVELLAVNPEAPQASATDSDKK